MAPDPGSRTRPISYHLLCEQGSAGEDSEQAQRVLSYLLLSTTTDVAAPLRADVETLLAAGHPMDWAVAGGDGGNPLPAHRRLTPTASPDRLRGLLAGAVATVSSPSRRALQAARLDPWFQQAVGSVDVVLALDEGAVAVLETAGEWAPQTHRFGPDEAARVVVEQAGWNALEQAWEEALAAGRTEQRADGFGRALLAALGRLTGTGRLAQADPREVHWLLAHLARHAAPELVGQVATALLGLPGVGPDDAVVLGYAAVADLDATAVTGAAVTALGTRALAQADTYLAAKDLAMTVRVTGMALDLLFHRELHSDVERSELVEDPARLGRLLRASTVGDLLTRPAPPAKGRREPWPERTRTQVQAVVLSGPYGTTYRPVLTALAAAPRTTTRVLDLRQVDPTFRTLGSDLTLLRYRLDRALGRPGRGSDGVREGLDGAAVVFANWADKGAVLASLELPAQTRLTVRVHSVDALRPWLHLIDWSQVDHLVCVSDHVADLVRALLGDRLADTGCHVVANTVELERFAGVSPPAEHRVLCLVGWAQRVKDPLWALQVLARLRATDPRWRLLLIGADFADNMTVSGRRYAEEFRRRAMCDDVREAVEYVGFTDDLPAEVARAGFVVSASRREAWPVGPMEAAAGGAVPVVRDWPLFASRGSAARFLPADWVVADVDQAVARIGSLSEREGWQLESERARRVVASLSDTAAIDRDHRRIVLGRYAELGDLVAIGRDAEAVALVQEQVAWDDPVLLRVANEASRTLGEVTRRYDLQERLVQTEPGARLLQGMRTQLGRLRETSAHWVPTVDGVVEPVTPVPGRVLHVLKASMPYRESGYAVRSLYTLRGQHEAGLDVLAVTALDFPADTEGVPAEQQVGGVRHLRLRRDEVPEAEPVDLYLDAWASALARTAVRERPDVIHVHSGHRGFETALVALAVGRAIGRPVIYEVRGFFESLWSRDPERAESGESYRHRRETEERCMRAAAAVVTLSDSMRDDIVSRGIDPATVHVVPNAVDGALFPPRPRSAELARRWGLEGRFVFGYVSNLDHYREGHELLIEAAVRLQQQGVPATALIVGGGRRAEQLHELAERLGAGPAVVFTDRVPHEQVHDFYALCDVFVIPRVDERAGRLVTPLKPYEAMALNIPLVVSDLPALLEVTADGERGRSFHAGDVDSLVAVLEAARADPDGGQAVARRARDWVLAERTWQANAELYREIYAGLARSTPRWPAQPEVIQSPERDALLAEIRTLEQALLTRSAADSVVGIGSEDEPDVMGLRWRRQVLRAALGDGTEEDRDG